MMHNYGSFFTFWIFVEGHTRSHKVTQGHKRSHKVTQGHTRWSSGDICRRVNALRPLPPSWDPVHTVHTDKFTMTSPAKTKFRKFSWGPCSLTTTKNCRSSCNNNNNNWGQGCLPSNISPVGNVSTHSHKVIKHGQWSPTPVPLDVCRKHQHFNEVRMLEESDGFRTVAHIWN